MVMNADDYKAQHRVCFNDDLGEDERLRRISVDYDELDEKRCNRCPGKDQKVCAQKIDEVIEASWNLLHTKLAQLGLTIDEAMALGVRFPGFKFCGLRDETNKALDNSK